MKVFKNNLGIRFFKIRLTLTYVHGEKQQKETQASKQAFINQCMSVTRAHHIVHSSTSTCMHGQMNKLGEDVPTYYSQPANVLLLKGIIVVANTLHTSIIFHI